MLRDIKQLTESRSLLQALRKVWRAGLSSFRERATLEHLEEAKVRLEKESLEAARLVHDYETKILSIIRENEELKGQNKELERVYHILRRENSWLKEEIFKLKSKE